MKADIPIPDEVLQLSDILGVELFVVGGVVRDYLFHILHGFTFDPKDIDIATAEHPDTILRLLREPKAKRAGVVPLEIGKSFGVVAAVFPSGNKYEIATFRSEWYDPITGDGRHPDKVEFSTPQADAQRRDLTVNSLFYEIANREIVDYVGTGIDDVKGKIIRTVGNPLDRFGEDKLRVVRLIRFFSRYNSCGDINDLEVWRPSTLAAIEKFKTLPGISGERIRNEFLSGITQAITPSHFLRTCHHLGLMPAMFPGITPTELSITSRNPHIILAAMFGQEPIKGLCDALNQSKYSADEVRHVKFLRSLDSLSYDRAYEFVRMRGQFCNLVLSEQDQAINKAALDREVEDYCHAVNLDVHLPLKLMEFEPITRATSFPELSGPELGSAIREEVGREFMMFAQIAPSPCAS